MSVTVMVIFDELPEQERGPFRSSESQAETLLDIEEKYRKEVVARLSDAQHEHMMDSRHFWYNEVFQPHVGRSLYHISTAPVVELRLRRDNYLVSTPWVAETVGAIDPELTVKAMLEEMRKGEKNLKKYKLFSPACCFEVLVKDRILEEDKALYAQKVRPYVEEDKRNESHLRIRLKASLMRKAYGLLFLCALAGLFFGW